MSRARPALAAVLLVVASATAAIAIGGASAPVEPGDDPVVGSGENTTRVLLLTEADAAAFDSAAVSVTDTLDAGRSTLDASFRLNRVRQKLAATDSETRQRAILENASSWADQRVATLREQESQARAAFASGSITAESYLVTLATIHRKASTLERYLRNPTDGTPGLYGYASDYSALQTDINRDRMRLAMLNGPVRERLAEVVRGQRDSLRVHVTTGNGVMLSTIDGEEYVRETVRPDNADPVLGGSIGNGSDVVQSMYPWLHDNRLRPSIDLEGNYAYVFTAGFDHGQLATYIDTTTERVFVEHQHKRLSRTPTEVETETTRDNATLSVSRTYTGGPVQVRLENATGAPIDEPVTLNGSRIGETGDDGVLWTLSPAGDYPVTVTHDGSTLEVNVTARPAP